MSSHVAADATYLPGAGKTGPNAGAFPTVVESQAASATSYRQPPRPYPVYGRGAGGGTTINMRSFLLELNVKTRDTSNG